MHDSRRQIWVPYIRRIADEIGLKDYDVKVSDSEPDNKEHEAEISITYGRKFCTIFLSNSFLENEPESQRETICHELTHVHLQDFKVLVKLATDDYQWKMLHLSFEHAVDAMARVIAPFMPLPEFEQ